MTYKVACSRAGIIAYGVLINTLPADEVLVHVDGVHPTHMARTGKVWVKQGEKLHIRSYTGRQRIDIHIPLDNALYHYSTTVREWLVASGRRIVLHFLPAYCPHLNPIERLWHILHNCVTRNKYHKTYSTFSEAVMTLCRQTIKTE